MDLEKIEFGKWYWYHGTIRPVFALYPHTDDAIVCLAPDLRPGSVPKFVFDYAKIEFLADINPSPSELDY